MFAFDEPALIDEGHSSRQFPVRLDDDVMVLRRKQLRVGECEDCTGIVHRAALHVVVARNINL